MNSISKSYKIFRESVNALINTPEYAEVAPDLERLKRCLNPLFIFTHLMTRGSGSSANELDDHICDHLGAEEAPTVSALTQALHSYTPGLFKKLFKIMVDKLPLNETFKNYLLTAYDGSKINIFFDHIMEDYFFPAKKKKSGTGYH